MRQVDAPTSAEGIVTSERGTGIEILEHHGPLLPQLESTFGTDRKRSGRGLLSDQVQWLQQIDFQLFAVSRKFQMSAFDARELCSIQARGRSKNCLSKQARAADHRTTSR